MVNCGLLSVAPQVFVDLPYLVSVDLTGNDILSLDFREIGFDSKLVIALYRYLHVCIHACQTWKVGVGDSYLFLSVLRSFYCVLPSIRKMS